MTKISVLVADDHPVVREGLGKIIGQFDDLELVGTATTGEDAVEKAAVLAPRVVLMDVRMGGMDGVEATRALRARCPRTEVIVLTNYDEDDYIFRALRAGAKGYLLKDVSADALADAVRTVARGESSLDGALVQRVLRRLQQGDARPAPPGERLTAREREVLGCLVAGRNNQEIADQLVVSEKTVKSHLTSIYRKLNVRDRSQAIVTAIRGGYVDASASDI